jgi:hypothetical protein
MSELKCRMPDDIWRTSDRWFVSFGMNAGHDEKLLLFIISDDGEPSSSMTIQWKRGGTARVDVLD